MSAKQDLVEAHAFNRRRLVTAFLSGAPGGREVEPIRYGRAIVGGVVLAVLVVAGAAVGGFLKPPVPDGWDDDTLVVVEETGARFFAQHDEDSDETLLFPIINTTSARLILGDETGAFPIETVPVSEVRDAVIGDTVGIPGAPDTVPDPSDLVQTGWTACLNQQGGIKVVVDEDPGAAAADGQGFVAKDDAGARFLVAGTRRYPVPRGRAGDNALRQLGQNTGGTTAPGQWLNLMPVGPPLETFSVPGSGEVVDTGVPGINRIGTPIDVDGTKFVVVRDGSGAGLFRLTDFAYAVYRSGDAGAELDEVEPDAEELTRFPSVESVEGLDFLDDWPEDVPTSFALDTPCLMLTEEDQGSERATTLAAPDPERVDETVPGTATLERQVQAGHGALVREGTPGVRINGSSLLIDSSGTRYALGEGGQDFRGQLGYAAVDPPDVSAAWTRLFDDGPVLTAQAAVDSARGSS